MPDLSKIKGFEWDRGNIDKSYEKHGITAKEAEEVFLDNQVQIKRDFQHEKAEKRYIAIGRSKKEKILFIVFTIRKDKIRIISSRTSNKKERRLYEEKTKINSKV